MTSVSTAELRRHLADYLNIALRGEVVYITSNGRPVAALAPVAIVESTPQHGARTSRVAHPSSESSM